MGKYSDQEVAGTDPDNGEPVIVTFVTSELTPEISGAVPEQNVKFAALKEAYPFVRVTSHLEDVTYWETLRIGVWRDVPDSCVHDRGRPFLYDSYVQNGSYGRVSVR